MESLNYLTDQALLNETLAFAKKEKNYSVLVIRHIAEINRRKAFTILGYSSLFDYCVSELKFSKSQAFRRIEAAKLIKAVPEVEKKLAEGDLNLTQVGMLAPLFNELRATNVDQKKIVNEVQNLSTRDLEKFIDQKLIAHNPEKFERKIEHKEEKKLSVILDAEIFAMIKEIKERKIHQGRMNEVEIIKEALKNELSKLQNKFALKRKGPKVAAKKTPMIKVKTGAGKKTEQFRAEPKPKKISRHIPNPLKREIWQRAGGRCESVVKTQATSTGPNWQSSVKCGSTFGLEFHHLNPYSFGPEHTAENLQLLCKSHHQRQGVQMKFRF